MRTNACSATVTVLVIVGLTMVSASVAEGQEPSSERERRAPSGFLGMRGKKSEGLGMGMMQDEDYPAGYDPIAARIAAAMSMPTRGKKAPSGFLGMRGKKSDEVYGDAAADYELEALLKRAPSGFLGMRGKKAPSGFLGMRGKKAPSGFLGMRGKKMYENDADMDAFIEALSAMAVEGQEQKRAPSGFLGMRGKKSTYEDQAEAESNVVDKRAPSGFLGMRG